jgi:tRNA1(Val) A37 N6-methylase TrmN6
MRTTEHLRQDLDVSSATINNWVKTGVIPPYPNGKKYFDDTTYQNLLQSVKINFQKLQKRANRSQNVEVVNNNNPVSNTKSKYVIEVLASKYKLLGISLDSFMWSISTYFLQKKGLILVNDNIIQSDNLDFTDFLLKWKSQVNANDLFVMFDEVEFPENEVDFLGSVYESLRTIGEKSHFGAFFTPAELVSDIEVQNDKSILDPCAGTGSILLSILSKSHNPNKIFLRDIDELALNIAKVNFSLFFGQTHSLIHTEVKNILFDKTNLRTIDLFTVQANNEQFDYIITNPPYGAKLTSEEKSRLIRAYPEINTTESFSISLYNSMQKMSRDSKFCFVLPESILYVDTHLNIRKYLFESGKKTKITHFGNAFKGVMSKIIRLEIENKPGGLEIINNDFHWTVPHNLLRGNAYRPPYLHTEIEATIIGKILNIDSFILQGKCKFGLGIVTGNNELNLKNNEDIDLEPIFTGKELLKFKFNKPKYYIDFKPENLQQVAPKELYRIPKICYRFISDSIITVADSRGCLILNSVNFLIPNQSISIRALSSFLNSPLVTFIYRRLFNSTKVLKNHIEAIPVPISIKDHWPTLEKLYEVAENGEDITARLNFLVCGLYGLNEIETEHILSRSNGIS